MVIASPKKSFRTKNTYYRIHIHSTHGKLVLIMVLNSTIMFISMSTFVSNHVLQIVIWAQGNKSFMRPSQVNMGSDWALQSHSNLLMCEQEHFIQEPPMIQMWILSTPQPHSLQLPSFWVSPGSLLWANCMFHPPNFHWRYISVVHCKGDLPLLLKNAWTITFLHGTEP